MTVPGSVPAAGSADNARVSATAALAQSIHRMDRPIQHSERVEI
jgi:hypothetical protein